MNACGSSSRERGLTAANMRACRKICGDRGELAMDSGV
jgi:hypothetical protein